MKTTMIQSVAKKAMMLMAFISFITLTSCSGDNPEAVAEKFLNHVNKAEFEEAKKYCDKKTGELIGMMASMAGGKTAEMKDKDIKTEIISSEIKDEKASVKYKIVGKDAPADSKEQSIDLIKEDGKWKVTIDKENANKEGGAPATEEPADSLDTPIDSLEVDSLEMAE
ncbi:DUF4878 domain-containing protein [Flavobacterium sp. NST-5]|uniref:DUF4878 domain-containing protein n=1 Tax=Flavobacterium ichthyis TaxID=2698827 RepID=A0ABW9Z4U4_9FLAO|nr:DUF4878 domain-containing protein [Flavobacterium ichthyis]NBL63659.1 DUF4878 domain-containing protein [Flavobacterium ichthyis]